MKKLFVLFGVLALLISANAFAAYEVKASAGAVDFNNRIYEVCGVVTGGPVDNIKVVLEVDPGKNVGYYVTHTNTDGRFCQLLHVYSGINISVIAGTAEKVLLQKISVK